jgi:DnaJ homologue, subfamily C, member 28, conserved domain
VAPRTPRQWESAVDKQIREAQERGEFDNLPGSGKPLNLQDWDKEWGLAFHVLKQAGETLPWIALRNDIDLAQANLQRLLRDAAKLRGPERARARERYLREAAALDKMLEEYAFVVPIRHLERGRLPRHIAEQQFDTAIG